MNIEAKQPKSPKDQKDMTEIVLNKIKEKGFTISEVLYIFNDIITYLVSEKTIN